MKKGNDIKFISSKENGISFIKNSIKDVEKNIKKGNISDIIYLNNLYNALSNISKQLVNVNYIICIVRQKDKKGLSYWFFFWYNTLGRGERNENIICKCWKQFFEVSTI